MERRVIGGSEENKVYRENREHRAKREKRAIPPMLSLRLCNTP